MTAGMTFTPVLPPPTVLESLVVAGGGPGGGGPYNGGGGGAGGLIYNSGLPVTTNVNYTVTVGAGGTGTTTQGSNGLNSQIISNNSYSFNGSSQYLTVAANAALAFGTGDFTVEGWVYLTSGSTYQFLMGSSASGGMMIGFNVPISGTPTIAVGTHNVAWVLNFGASISIPTATWTHVAITRSGSTNKAFINGVQLGANITDSTSWAFTGNSPYIGCNALASFLNGNISNLRLVKGVSVYTGNFTVPTSPLAVTQSAGTNISAITGTQTSLLTLQNATIIDNSTYALSITNTGGVAFSSSSPIGIITFGGGAGGSHPANPQTGLAGGSGGGGSQAGGAGGAGTSGQGNAGGGLIYAAGGGGGGAGAAVLTPGMTTGPYTYGTAPVTGGVGLQFSISGTSTYYGGGGGGGGRASLSVPQGPGGLGGGGAGGAATGTNAGTAGTVNTGGGGGGIGSNSEGGIAAGGSGGSGIAIIRYQSIYAQAATTGSPTFTSTGGYNIYTWTSSGSFSFSAIPTPTVEYLVVAGGGGAGLNNGGGGAGGYRTAASFAVDTGTSYTITVGTGGAGSSSQGVPGTNGTSSVFSTITSAGGGGGGSFSGGGANAGQNGGSGGGAGGADSGQTIQGPGLGNTPSTTPSQGNNGGSGVALNTNSGGGGGGGAGAVGGNGSGSVAGNGGIGAVSTIITAAQATTYAVGQVSSSSVYFAGGGGAGTNGGTAGSGGLGGGANGKNSGTGNNGTANTGGGAGAGGASAGGTGGSGVVIVRYLDTYAAAASTTGTPSVNIANGYRTYIWTSSGSITF